MTTFSPGTQVYDKFHGWTAEVIRAERVEDGDWSYDSYTLKRIGNPPARRFSLIEVGTEYAQDGSHVRAV
jgi:hypothetical protein